MIPMCIKNIINKLFIILFVKYLVNSEKMIAKEKLKVSESRHNNETNVHKINLEEMIKVLNSLKSKVI